MSRRFFLGESLPENQIGSVLPPGNGYDSSAPGGIARKWGFAINGPLNASRMGMRSVERLNCAADMQAAIPMMPVRDPEYIAKTRQFAQQYTSSAKPVGVRWWAAGGARPIQPMLQGPDDPLPPLVDDN